jgi:hypothetical protein
MLLSCCEAEDETRELQSAMAHSFLLRLALLQEKFTRLALCMWPMQPCMQACVRELVLAKRETPMSGPGDCRRSDATQKLSR